MATEQVEALRAYRQVIEWDAFRSSMPTPGNLQHMELAEDADSPGVKSWELKPGPISGELLFAPLASAEVSFTPKTVESSSIDLEVTVTWKTLGSGVTNRTTQLVTFSENK
jgi:hypothetical protein